MKCTFPADALRQTAFDEWKLTVTLSRDSVADAMRILDEAAGGKVYELTAKPYREKRTTLANAYFHKLASEIAAQLGATIDEIKTRLVVSYGAVEEQEDGEPVTVAVPRSFQIERLYQYTEYIGGDFDTAIYVLHKQTRDMNGREFARLVEATVNEAKELGIETMPPAELMRLYAQANEKYGNTSCS